MAIPKLFEAFHFLETNEWTSLSRYLMMQTGSDTDNYRLFKLLYKNKASLTDEGLSEKIRTKHFSKLNPKAYSNLLSKIFSWFEEWFAVEIFKMEAYEKELMLIKGYNQRGFFKQANKVANRLESRIKKKQLDIGDNAALVRLYDAQYYSSNPIKDNKGNSLFNDFLNSHLDEITERSFKCLIEIGNRERTHHEDNKKFVNTLSQIVKTTEPTPLSKILVIAQKALTSKNMYAFNALKEELESDTIDPQSDLFLVLCIYLRKTASAIWHNKYKGDVSFIYDCYQLNLKAFDKNKNQKLMPAFLFNSVSTLGAFLDYKQTDAFILKWIDKIHTKHKESALKYCQALNAFRHEKYKVIPELLQGLEFDQLVYKYVSGALLIIAQYKLDEEDLTFTLVHNFKKQLKRNYKSIPKNTALRLSNLIEVIILLQKAKYDRKIKIDFDQYEPFFFKTWVLKEKK